MEFWILATLIGLVLIASVIPFYQGEAWWWRGFDFPRLQLALTAAALILVAIVVLDPDRWTTWCLVGVATVAFAIQGWWIAPFTKLFPEEVKGVDGEANGNSVSVMTANVYQPNPDKKALVDLVRAWKPDILVALETDDAWLKGLEPLERDYPYTIKCPLSNKYGMTVYSKLPLENAKTQFLVEAEVPSMHVLAVLPCGRRIRIHFLHPAPPSPTENEESLERDAELLIVGKSVLEARAPVIVTGDLNDVAWSTTTRLFRKVSGLLDPRVGRGMFSSYNAKRWYFRWPLDHLFCSEHFRLARIERLPAFGSDHFPLFMELRLSDDPATEGEGLEADGEDEKLAARKKAAMGVDASKVHAPEKREE